MKQQPCSECFSADFLKGTDSRSEAVEAKDSDAGDAMDDTLSIHSNKKMIQLDLRKLSIGYAWAQSSVLMRELTERKGQKESAGLHDDNKKNTTSQ